MEHTTQHNGEVATAPRLLTPQEICRTIGISRRQLDHLLAMGMPVLRFSTRVIRFDYDAVLEWVAVRNR